MKSLWQAATTSPLVTPWLFTNEGIKVMGAGDELESPTLILPRKYLLYFYIDVAQVPHSVRANFIAQKVKQSSPFAEPDYLSVVENGGVQLWVWDKARVTRYQIEQELENLPVVPETLLYPPTPEGFNVQPCAEGWELQYWEANCLLQSRWLSVAPQESVQADFVRAVNHKQALVEWKYSGRELLTKPFHEKPFWTKENILHENVLPKFIFGFLAAFLLWQVAQAVGVYTRHVWVDASATRTQKALAERVSQRDLALSQQEFNKQVIGIINTPSQLHLLSEIQQCLEGQKYMILDWQYQRGQLSVLLQQDQPDTRALVENCSKNPQLGNVHTEPGATTNQTRLLLRVNAAVVGDSNVNPQ